MIDYGSDLTAAVTRTGLAAHTTNIILGNMLKHNVHGVANQGTGTVIEHNMVP